MRSMAAFTWRNGEPGHGTAVAVNASAFGLAYVW